MSKKRGGGQSPSGQQAKKRNRRLFQRLNQVARQKREQVKKFSRQVPYEDLFSELYSVAGGIKILQPPYSPDRMYELAEENGVLSACIEAYVHNIHGYGFDIVPVVGTDADVEGEDESIKETLRSFFEEPNGEESFQTIAEKLRRDLEATSNAYLEVYRDMDGKPSMVYWMDAKRMRLCALDDDPTDVKQLVVRNGKASEVTVSRKFRRFAMLNGVNFNKVTYFRQFGDPRQMDAKSGDYRTKEQAAQDVMAGEAKEFSPATEVIHFKVGNGTYGVPRWIGNLMSVMGIPKAEYVNYDLFDNQGIPPMLMTVAGGSLTEESFEDLASMLAKAKSVENFNKFLLLEVEGSTAADGTEQRPSVDIKNMVDFRKEDAMFLAYLKDAREAIRKYGFRLPGMFVGQTDDTNYASAKMARETAEDQVFIPERRRFDELVTTTLVRALGSTEYKFKSQAPTIKSNAELAAIMPKLIDAGAFTVNELIAFANNTFGANLAMYDPNKDAWADLPVPSALQILAPTIIGMGVNVEGEGGDAQGKGKDNAIKFDKDDLAHVRMALAIGAIEQFIRKQAHMEFEHDHAGGEAGVQ